MASRLFRAVVGVGISLGAASAACGEIADGSFGEHETSRKPAASAPSDASAPKPSFDAATSPHDATASDRGDAGAPDIPDVTVFDSAIDPIDAAFCDVTWPTTKGSVAGPTCGDTEACSDAGPAPGCAIPIDLPLCSQQDWRTTHAVAWCVNGAWQCSAGSVPAVECSCWSEPGSGTWCVGDE